MGNIMSYKNLICIVCFIAVPGLATANMADFDDNILSPDSYYSGTMIVDAIMGNYDTSYINSGHASFENHSDGDWNSWGGFALSNMVDITTAGYLNQYSTYAGAAQSGSNFAVGFMDTFNGYNPTMILNNARVLDGLYLTNTTYVAQDMLNGSAFSKIFGGATGDDPDWLKVIIEGFDVADASVGTEEFYLADFRFADNGLDYIVDAWQYVDLAGLGVVKSVVFSLESSDTGAWGINTPTYFAMDTVVPEPATMALLALGGMMIRRKRK